MNQSFARNLIIVLLIPYSLFLIEFITKDISIRNIIKVIAAVFGPVPIAIFFAYLFIAEKNLVREIDQAAISAFVSFAYLSIAILLSIITFYCVETCLYERLTETVAPIFFNSFILMAYIINILYTKHIQTIAILSGMSIGISFYVLFLT